MGPLVLVCRNASVLGVYFTAILPELADHYQHRGDILEPSSRLKNAAAWRKETESL